MAGQQKNAQDQDLNQLRKVRREKLAELQARGEDPFLITKYDVTHHSQEIKDHFEELENKEVSVAGRIMQKRVMGKASSATFRIWKETSSLTLRETISVKTTIKILRSLISVIS